MKRHFATVHSNEKEVAELLQETDQKRRLLRVQQLRNLGNHLHNISVLKKGRGRFVIARRPNTQHSSTTSELVKQYHPCVYCYGYYAKFQYWRHSKKCALKPGNWESLDRDTVSHSLLPFDKDLQARVGLVLSQCRSDRVTRVIQRDRIIIKVLECKMRRTRSNNKGALGAVRTSIRHLGKLVLELRNLTGERDAFLEDFFNVSKVDQLFEALMLTAEECGRHRFLKSIHTMLNSGITFLLAESIEARDSAKEESIRSFDRTFQSKWDDLYSTLKVLNLEEEKRTLFELKLAPHSAGESAGKQQKASEPVENSEAAPENGEQSAAELADQLRLLCDEEQNGKKDIERCMMKESVLSHRSWKNIKDFCRNTTQKIQKSKN
nr:hypothetical protein BaRGS_015228 [Batillaria attramentaria]